MGNDNNGNKSGRKTKLANDNDQPASSNHPQFSSTTARPPLPPCFQPIVGLAPHLWTPTGSTFQKVGAASSFANLKGSQGAGEDEILILMVFSWKEPSRMTREAVARHDGREMSGYLSPPSRPLSPGRFVVLFCTPISFQGAESTKSSRSLHKLGCYLFCCKAFPI